ncbi:MAG TPA: SDR family oxidoreductase [Puia sp.]|jgi:NAD(P)-dependent dehydrogenase (short-subunit alcohol dehydrogenase family)|nr:SDR family oxidoreductase [Puia sp.]
MNRLLNKTAVITGGNSGIGLATAREFIAEGARVIITGRNKTSLDKAVAELGAQAQGIVSDTSNIKDVLQLGQQVSALLPKVDVLFINAGIAKFSPIEEVSEAFFDEQFDTNVKGAFFTIQQLLPLMGEGGSIVLNTSINAHVGMPGASIYGASKAAVLTFAKNLSAELLSKKIRVNAISPGPVATPLHTKLGVPEDEHMKQTAGLIPLGRFGTPQEIARIAVFFASEDSSFVLGAELIADGGMATL